MEGVQERSRLLAYEAQGNLQKLYEHPCPGDGLVVGLDEAGERLVLISWIMKNGSDDHRIFARDGARIYTEFAGPSESGGDPALIYSAMRDAVYVEGNFSVASNGAQTDAIIGRPFVDRADNLTGNLGEKRGWTHGLDEPNFTSRIAALGYWCGKNPHTEMYLLRRSPFGGCDRNSYKFGSRAGFGFCLHTYAGNDDPLPPFRGEPFLVPLDGEIEDIANRFWETLASDKMALAVKFIPRDAPPEVHIINE